MAQELRRRLPPLMPCWVPPAGTQVHGARVPDEDEEIPPFFDTYLDYKDFCVGYRSELSQVVRLTSTLLPEAALQAAQHRLKTVLQICGAVAGPQPQVGLACEVLSA